MLPEDVTVKPGNCPSGKRPVSRFNGDERAKQTLIVKGSGVPGYEWTRNEGEGPGAGRQSQLPKEGCVGLSKAMSRGENSFRPFPGMASNREFILLPASVRTLNCLAEVETQFGSFQRVDKELTLNLTRYRQFPPASSMFPKRRFLSRRGSDHQ